MFPFKPETISQQNTTSISTRSPFSFTMGPFTIYPLFLLPLIFWISPISSASTAAASSKASEEREHRLHPDFTQESLIDPELENVEFKPLYMNPPLNPLHPLNQQQQKHQKLQKFYQSNPVLFYPSPYSYRHPVYNYNYPNIYQPAPPQHSYPLVSINPYMAQSPYIFAPSNYQSPQLYDPYAMMMQLGQAYSPQKYPYQPNILMQSPSPYMSQQSFHSVQPNANNPYPSVHHQAKPLPSEIQQLLNTLQTEGSTSQMVYASSSSEPTSLQFTTSSKGQQQPTSQMRHPNDDLSEILRNPPPKAMMVTTSDVLRAAGRRPHIKPISFHYSSAETHKPTLYKNGVKNGHLQNPLVFNFNNQILQDFDFKTERNQNLKSSNGTEEEEEEPTFISEPIIPNSMLSLPNWEMINAVMAKSKKDAKPEEAHNILSQQQDANESVKKEHAPELDIFDHSADPIPLFVTGDEEDMYFAQGDTSQNDQTTFPYTKAQIYRCPSSRSLTDMKNTEIFADPLRCNQFYYCRNSAAYVFRCPVNYAFNAVTNVCEKDVDFACTKSLK